MGRGIGGRAVDDPFFRPVVISKSNENHEALELGQGLVIGYRTNLTSWILPPLGAVVSVATGGSQLLP